MKEPRAQPLTPPPLSAFGPPGCSTGAPPKESQLPEAESGSGPQPSGAKEGPSRYKQEQATVHGELTHVARRDREAATKHAKASLPRGESGLDQEKQKAARLECTQMTNTKGRRRGPYVCSPGLWRTRSGSFGNTHANLRGGRCRHRGGGCCSEGTPTGVTMATLAASRC
ncbi:MICOS complex subunit MIC25 [Tupaia chinensis]|uniref:MICOS complex subunit MIC25 n=1 Tax=Tupaia chinensis TaxID=246437 RepID=UPI0007047023|nr:MICOS complex subunit MIC25 [Tupaia chinensis]